VSSKFGHALIATGNAPSRRPKRLFHLIAEQDFSKGRGRFQGGSLETIGKQQVLHLRSGEVGVWRVPVKGVRDLAVLAVLRAEPAGHIYWHTFGEIAGNNKLCPGMTTTLTLDDVLLPPSFNYCDGAGRIDALSKGIADPYHAGYRKHLSFFSEPNISGIYFAGPKHWAIVYTRLEDFRTQHPDNRPIAVDAERIRGIFTHTASRDQHIYIKRIVMFRGIDVGPPNLKPSIRIRPLEEGRIRLSWKPATDNTAVTYYEVNLAHQGRPADRHAAANAGQVLRVPSTEVAVDGRGLRKVTIRAVDFFENVSEPVTVTLGERN